MAFSAGNQAALKAAQDIINRGQATGDQSVVDAGMRAQGKILADEGISYQAGNGAGTTGGGGITYAGAVSGGNGGSGKGDALMSDLKNLYSSGGAYSAALAAQQRAQQANVDKAVSTLQGQKQATEQSYAELFRQLYKQKMNAQKNVGQKMAAQGVTGGASESTLLGMETGYAEALRQGEQGRISAIGDIDRAITAAQLDGDIAKAQLAAESARAQTDSYADVLRTMVGRYDNQQAQQTAYEREDAANKLSYARQLAISIAQGGNMPTDDLLTAAGMTRADAEAIVTSVAQSRQDEQDALTYSQALQKAQTLAGYGDFSGYAALGYTEAEIAAMKTAYDKAVAAEKAASAPRYTPKTYTATQAEQALKIAMTGDTSDAVRRIIEGYYGLPMESVLAANGYMGVRPSPTQQIGNVDVGTYDQMAGNYIGVKEHLEGLKKAGKSNAEIRAAIVDAYESGVLNQSDYMRLYGQYR